MIQLEPTECRVLGVLVEKAQTVPGQYPITLNGLVGGCNQKNNRDPITDLDEERVLDALDGLRAKKLAVEAMLSGSRVSKYRHVARETLAVATPELVILAELLLRGPQSAGELRARASRMHPIDSLEAVQATLAGLMSRPEPLVKELPPIPGTRATRYAQLLCPTLHRLDGPGAAEPAHEPRAADGLEARVARLESEITSLRMALDDLQSRDPAHK